MGRDSATFRDKGTEVSSLSREKRTAGQAKNLVKGGDRPGQLKYSINDAPKERKGNKKGEKGAKHQAKVRQMS